MEKTSCWETADKLIAAGQVDAAVKLCESTPCSETAECQRFLAMTFYRGGQLEKALHWFSRIAERGDIEGVFGKASVYHARKEFTKALDLYKESADHGFARAYHWIATMYQNGLGVPPDLDLAATYYEKSKAHGYLIGERGLIHLARIKSTWLRGLTLWPRRTLVILRAFLIALRDANDQRLADIPHWRPAQDGEGSRR